MTTKITIRHEGPDHHDVYVERRMAGSENVQGIKLAPGDSREETIWDGITITVTETEKTTPPTT